MRNWIRIIFVLGLALWISMLPALAQSGRAIVTLVTPTYPIAVDATFDVVIQVETGGLPVDAAAAFLDFDPALFQVVNVQSGTALPIFLQSITDNELGRVDFAAGRLGGEFPSGSFSLATVTLRALAPVDAGLISLHTGDVGARRQTEVTFAGQSVIASAVGAMIMVSKDAAPPPENILAPNTVNQPFNPNLVAPVGVAPLPENMPEQELILPAVVPPFAISLDAVGSWVAEGGWSHGAQGGVSGAAWTSAPAATRSVLRFAHPIDLTAQSGVELNLNYRLPTAAAQGRVEIRTSLNPQWLPLVNVAPAANWTPLAVNLSAYSGQVIQLRFVWESATAVQDGWTLGAMSVNVSTAVPDVLPPVQVDVDVLPPVAPVQIPVAPGAGVTGLSG